MHPTSPALPRTTLVLVNWNAWSETRACLDSICLLEGVEQVRVVVCDNGSDNDSLDRLRGWRATAGPRPGARLVDVDVDAALRGLPDDDSAWVLVRNPTNAGFAGGCNVAIRHALARGDSDFVWLLNNDTRVEPGALAALLRTAHGDPRIAMVGSTLLAMGRDEIQARGGGGFDPRRGLSAHIGEGEPDRSLTPDEVAAIETRMRFIVGASMFVRTAFIRDVGLMQEDYFLYFEELDWAERARRASPPWRLAYAPDSRVSHHVGASVGQYARSIRSVRFYTRSRLLFTRRFHPGCMPTVRLRLAREALAAFVKGRRAAAGVLAAAALAPDRTTARALPVPTGGGS